MNSNKYKNLVIILYTFSISILISLIYIKIRKIIVLSTYIKLILLLTVTLLIYIAGYIYIKKVNNKKKILYINIIIYFLIYNVTIFSLTLFDEIYGRNGLTFVTWNKRTFTEYINTSLNIVPFKTIKLFINGYKNNLVTREVFAINVIGNLCAFMPYGFFIPLLFKKINKYYKFLILMLIIVIIIEILQFLTMSGSCDIDDLILNITGASIIYLIFNIKSVNKFIRSIFIKHKNVGL